MKLERFRISFESGNDHFYYNCIKMLTIEICLKNQNILKVRIENGLLICDVDFFIVENIFYWFDSETNQYFLTNYSDENWKISIGNQSEFKRNGFYPLSKTTYHEQRVLLSFLRYEFGRDVTINSLLFSILGKRGNLNSIISSFQCEIYFFCEKLSTEKLILPLSGGIDSRLLLDFFKDYEFLYSYTHGEVDSGDVLIVKRILEKVPIANHKFFDISKLSSDQIFRNIKNIDFFLPLERVLYPIPEDIFPDINFLILSGLYGDVIFSDKTRKVNFSNYLYSSLNDISFDSIDNQVINCYSESLISEKLALLLLRCQKLTKQSLNIDILENDCFIPFLKNSVLAEVEDCSEKFLYKRIIKNIMSRELRLILHQTTLSHFTMPEFVRFLEKVFHKLLYKKYSKPYFSKELVVRFDKELLQKFKNDNCLF
jgi:hypothetical protein